MAKKLFYAFAAIAAMAMAGCSVFITTPPTTTVKAENDLTNLSVDVGGVTTNVDGIDLADVTIGDVYFPYIQAGYVTGSKNTNRSGEVTVLIDTAIVFTKVLGQTTELDFPKIDPMSATIAPNQSNKVVFDESTATVIFNRLAKRRS